MARILFGSYRRDDASDPEVYIAGVVRILSAYPLDIVSAVTDPLTGLPSKPSSGRGLPFMHEIKAACEEIAGPRRRWQEWDEGAHETEGVD